MNRRGFFHKAGKVLAGIGMGAVITAPVSASGLQGGGNEMVFLRSEIDLLKGQLADAQRIQLMFDEDLDIARGDIANLYTGVDRHEEALIDHTEVLKDLMSRHYNPLRETIESKEMMG